MTTLELLEALTTYGVIARIEEGELKMTASRKPPRELLDAVRQHKQALMRHLAHVVPDDESVRLTSVSGDSRGAVVAWETVMLEAIEHD